MAENFDFAGQLIKRGTKEPESDQGFDFAGSLVNGNRATSGRQGGGGGFPDLRSPIKAYSDPSKGASVADAFVGGIPTDPEAAKRYFAQKRGIPEDRYAFLDGNIVYRADDGKWYKEVSGLASNIAYRVPDVIEMAPGIATGVAMAPVAMSSPAGLLGAGSTVAAVDAGMNYGRQKLAGAIADQRYDPFETVLSAGLSFLGETAPMAKRVAKERRIASDFGQRNLVTEATLRAKAGQYGVPLTAAEITSLPSLMTQQKVLGNIAPSSNKMEKFYVNREAAARSAVNDYLRALSPVDDVADAGKMGQDALIAQKASLEKQRDDAVRPIYEQAFANAAPVDTSGVLSRVDSFMAKAPEGSMMGRYLARMRQMVQGGDLATLHNAKMELDAMFKEEAFGSLDKTMQRQLMGVKDELVSAMGKANPQYTAANQEFARLSQPLNEFNDRITGTSLTRIQPDNLKNFASRIFENPSAKTVDYAKKQIIAGGGESAWDAVLRAHLENAWSASKKPSKGAMGQKLDAGRTWNNILFGDEKQDTALRVALEPQQYQALRDLSMVLEAAGKVKKLGSDTAFNQLITEELQKNPPMTGVGTGAARVAGALLQPQNYGKMISDFAVKRDAMKNADQLVDIITNPDAIEKLKELRKMKPTEARYWAGLTQVLGSAGVLPAYRSPTDSATADESGN